ncbi:MAG: hypothetical protein R3C12_22445 [Planctomycetaceae bacterium]
MPRATVSTSPRLEFIRDAAQRTLVPQLGTPQVNPYTPGDLWREISHYSSTPATAQTFSCRIMEKNSISVPCIPTGSAYAPRRISLAFDYPGETCVVSRPSTPIRRCRPELLLNDVQFVEAARIRRADPPPAAIDRRRILTPR